MRSAKLTTSGSKLIIVFFLSVFAHQFSFAQENSPYSRYGLGNVVPAQNMTSRSMGGISAGFVDSVNLIFNGQSINLNNPASLGNIITASTPGGPVYPNKVIFDLGGEIAMRTLRSNSSPAKYKATNTLISYLQFAFPITPKKMAAKGNNWVMSFGLRPVTRVNYKVQQNTRVPGIDSVGTLYEGTGGLNQANISTGIRIKNFSFGVSSGYSFGNRTISTKKALISDSVLYALSNTETSARFGGVFLNLGAMYSIRTKSGVIRVGATANLQQNLKAKRDLVNETFEYNSLGEVVAIDTVNSSKDEKGTVKVPASYSLGFTYTNAHWIFGADVDMTQWDNYSYYGTKDPVKNTFTVRVGGQYYPASYNTPANKYWRFVRYRAGAYYGNDYLNLASSRTNYGITLGGGFPLTSFQRNNSDKFVVLNTGVELGQIGDKKDYSFRENIFRIHLGISMSATWFQKRKYD